MRYMYVYKISNLFLIYQKREKEKAHKRNEKNKKK